MTPERVLLHAGIADSRMYRRQLETLAPARAFDLPGFGSGPPEPNVVDYRTFVRDQLPDEPVTVVGTSLGGRIALELALESPDRVAALVLVGSGLDERGDFDAAVDADVRLWLADDVDAEVRRTRRRDAAHGVRAARGPRGAKRPPRAAGVDAAR